MMAANRARMRGLPRTGVCGLLACVAFMTMSVQAPAAVTPHPEQAAVTPQAVQGTAAPHAAQAVMDADRAFSAKAQEVGAGKAFSLFAEPRVNMLNDPVPGSNGADLQALFDPQVVLQWAPEDGAVSADGTLGYTWGKATRHRMTADGRREELSPSRYVTIWRKQADGSWKFLADGGLHGPEEREFAARKKAEKEAAEKAGR